MKLIDNKDEIIKYGNVDALKEKILFEKFNKDIDYKLWLYKKVFFEFERTDYPIPLNKEEIVVLEKIASNEKKGLTLY